MFIDVFFIKAVSSSLRKVVFNIYALNNGKRTIHRAVVKKTFGRNC